jgi:hypothetical protein
MQSRVKVPDQSVRAATLAAETNPSTAVGGICADPITMPVTTDSAAPMLTECNLMWFLRDEV